MFVVYPESRIETVAIVERSSMLRLEYKCGKHRMINSFIIPALIHQLTPRAGAAVDAATIGNMILEMSNKRSLAKSLHSISGWSPEVVDAVLKRLWNHGPKALEFFHLMGRHPSYAHSGSAYDHAIDISARMRHYKALWYLLAQMRVRGLGPSPKTYSIITERLVSSGKADKAVKVFPQDLNAFNTFLDVLCKSKRPEMALKLFTMLRPRFKPDTITYNILVNGFCLIKRTPKALELLTEMVERGLRPSLSTYNTMLKGYFRAGQLQDAWKFFLQMKRRKVEIDVVTYTTVVHGFGIAGEVIRARKVFDEMIDRGVLPSVSTYNALIQVFCKKDTVEKAIMLFQEMLRKGYVPNATTYNAEKMDEAIQYMDMMNKDGCEPTIQTYNVVIRFYCVSGEIEKALEIFERMGGRGCLPNLDTYNVLLKAMFVRKKSDDLVLAGRLLMEMVDRGFIPRKLTYNRVLNGLLLTGNQEFAREILRHQSKFGRIPLDFKI